MRADKSHEPEQPIQQSVGDTKEIKLEYSVHAELEPSPRILLNIDIGGRGLKFLYEPGSQYSMLPLNIFQQLAINILYGWFLESSAYCSFEEYRKELNFMCNTVRDKMDLRQAITVTYYDRKRQDSTLETGDFVLVYKPRLKREKLTQNGLDRLK